MVGRTKPFACASEHLWKTLSDISFKFETFLSTESIWKYRQQNGLFFYYINGNNNGITYTKLHWS